jgi:uncharacterized protein (TIGR00369 family)
MKTLNPAHVIAVGKKVNGCPYFTLLSMEISTLEWGSSRLEVLVRKKHLQPYGIVHGGVYASLLDAAAFWAAYTQTAEDTGLTTVEMKLNYLAPASEGRLIARGKCLKSGKTLCLSEASIEDGNGKLLVHGTSTLMILPSLKIEGQSEFPQKFLDQTEK